MSRQSLSCRIDWYPSMWMCAGLLGIGCLAAVALWLTALPRFVTAFASVSVLGYSAVLARNEALRNRCTLVWLKGDKAISVYSNYSSYFSEHFQQNKFVSAEDVFREPAQYWSDVHLVFRGPLVTLYATDEQGQKQQRHWLPDTLPYVSYRALRLISNAD